MGLALISSLARSQWPVCLSFLQAMGFLYVKTQLWFGFVFLGRAAVRADDCRVSLGREEGYGCNAPKSETPPCPAHSAPSTVSFVGRIKHLQVFCGWGSWACSAWRRESWEGTLEMSVNICRVGVRRMGPDAFRWCSATGQGAMGSNWSRGSSVWTWGRTSSLWGWRSTGTGCPGRLWSLLHWRYSRPAWTRSCAACCRWSCFGRGLDWVTHRGPFQPLPFCDSVLIKSVYSFCVQPSLPFLSKLIIHALYVYRHVDTVGCYCPSHKL